MGSVVVALYFLLCPLWLCVQNEGTECLHSPADRGQSQVDEHEEEEERPDGRSVHLKHGSGVGHEGEAGAALHDLE